MVGSCCAAALARLGLTIALIDPGPVPNWHPDDYQLRVSALNLASENILKSVDAWPLISTLRVSPFRQIEVWDAESTGQLTFNAADTGLSHLGHIVENIAVTSALIKRLSATKNVRLLLNDRIERVDSGTEDLSVRLASA